MRQPLTTGKADARYPQKNQLLRRAEGIFLGDSITRSNATYALDCISQGYGVTPLIVGLSGLRILYNAGVGGNNTTDVLARLDADVISKNPGWVYFRLGTNDMHAADKQIAMPTAQAQYIQIVERIQAAGIPLIIATVPPRSDSQATETRTSDGKIVWQALLEWNMFLRGVAEAYGVPLADEWTAGVDDNSINAWPSGWSVDGIHAPPLGALPMARVGAATLTKAVAANPMMLARLVEDTGIVDPYNLIKHGCFKTETLSSPATPTGWTQGGGMSNGAVNATAIVAPGVNDTDVAGNWFEITRSAANSQKGTAFQLITTGYEVGDIIELCGRIQTENLIADSYFVDAEARFQNGGTDIVDGEGTAVSLRALKNFICDVNEPNGIYFYARGPVPPGLTRIRVELSLGGNVTAVTPGKARFAQVTLRNLTALGLA